MTALRGNATCAQMSSIRAVCVYCGSRAGADPTFAEAARGLGKTLAQNGIRLIYGGGSIGLMGALAGSVLAHGGSLTGIIPDYALKPHGGPTGTMIYWKRIREVAAA